MREYTRTTTYKARPELADALEELSAELGVKKAVLVRAALKRVFPALAEADPLNALERLALGDSPVIPASSIHTGTKLSPDLSGDTDRSRNGGENAGCPSGWALGPDRPQKCAEAYPASPWVGEDDEHGQADERRPARPAPEQLSELAIPAPKRHVQAFTAAYFELEPAWALKTKTPSPKLLEQTALAITEAGGIDAAVLGLRNWSTFSERDPVVVRCFARSWWRLVQARVMSEDSPHYGKLYLTVFAENGWGGWTEQAEAERSQSTPLYAPWQGAEPMYVSTKTPVTIPLELDPSASNARKHARSAVFAEDLDENERIDAAIWEEWMGAAARARAAHDRRHAGGEVAA